MIRDTTFHSLRISSRVHETADTITLYFEIPASLSEMFRYTAGQYLNLRFLIKGQEYRRAYSLCTSPSENAWGVTIKMVDNGVVSAYILNNCREGDLVDVMPPEGLFTLTPDPERRRVYYMFAAGSGITPLMSQMRTLLEEEPLCTIHLYYGNRDQNSIIFKEWLDQAVTRYNGQLTVDHILSRPQKAGFLSGVFGKRGPLWLGETGRLDSGKVREFLERYPHYGLPAVYHICGPGDMIETVRAALLDNEVIADDIHTEYFTPTSVDQQPGTTPGQSQGAFTLVAHLRGQRIETVIREKTIIETLQDAGYDPPYSCTSGTCATCMAKVISGQIEMEQCYALSDKEIADGYVLTCQAHPVGGDVEVTYDY